MRFVVGDLDIGNGDGLLMARILAAMAANESATKAGGCAASWSRAPPKAGRTVGRCGRSATTPTG